VALKLLLSSVELVEVLLVDLLEELVREEAEEIPADIERLEDISRVVGSLSEEFALEFLEELEEKLIIV
jgi:hypothetical protein